MQNSSPVVSNSALPTGWQFMRRHFCRHFIVPTRRERAVAAAVLFLAKLGCKTCIGACGVPQSFNIWSFEVIAVEEPKWRCNYGTEMMGNMAGSGRLDVHGGSKLGCDLRHQSRWAAPECKCDCRYQSPTLSSTLNWLWRCSCNIRDQVALLIPNSKP